MGIGVMAIETGIMNGVQNMRLRGWALSLRRGRCWQTFNQKGDMDFWLIVLACVRHVCGVEEGRLVN